MKLPTAEIEEHCSQRSELAAYLDGELASPDELALEAHLAVCEVCRTELNEQKNLLRALNFALDEKIELPANFTEIIVVNAESKVSGLRRPRERFQAFFVCAALFALVVLSLGRETEAVLKTLADFAEQFAAVVGFGWRLFYEIALGAAIILRSIGSHLIYNSAIAATLAIVFVGTALFALLRFIHRSTELKLQTQDK